MRANSHFMRGKYLKLDVNPGENDHCGLCNGFAPLAENKSEILSFHLEKLLFKNGLFEHRADGFGILFDRQGGVNEWMIICKGTLTMPLKIRENSHSDCLSYNGQYQNVKDDCFRLRFHIENHNLERNDDLENIFPHSPMLTKEIIDDISFG